MGADRIGPVIVTERELAGWGELVGASVQPPLVMALRGELGAGKSVLARAVARGAGVTGPMPSPTFNLVLGYETPDGVEVYHLDLFRLHDASEIWELGWSEMGHGAQIVLIEWPERIEHLLPADRWDVSLSHVQGSPELRTLRVERHGESPELPPIELEQSEQSVE